jgi:putative Mn2+ efflux pump MntP
LASLATSIDACVVGVTLNFAHDPLLLSIVMIGIITFIDTFVASLVGSKLGEKLGDKLGNKLLIVGGIVLIGLGAKILISDLYFS